MAENFNLPFFEVSCKDNINVEKAFFTLARRIRETREGKDPFQENYSEEKVNTMHNKLDIDPKSCSSC